MKKLLLFYFSVALLSVASAEYGPNLIVNQDFSRLDAKGGLLNWVAYGKGYELTTDNLQPGRKKTVRISAEKENKGLYQVIYGKQGMAYRLEIDILPLAVYEGKLLALYVTLPQKDGTTRYMTFAEINKNNPGKAGEWQRLSAVLDLSKYPDNTGAFGLWCIAIGFDGEIYIDNFSCRQIIEDQ